MTTHMLRVAFIRCCFAFAFVLSAAPPSMAEYPDRPVRLIVPFPAGGATDAAARELAEGLVKVLGQQVVVENRPGADGAIAAQAVLGSASDGYTLLFASSSMAGIPFVQKGAPFKSMADFTAVSLVCRLAFGIVTSPTVPAHSIDELIAYARAHPDKLNYGSGSLSEVLAATQFMKATNTHMVQVNYKGGAQVVPDLTSGLVQVSFGPLTPMLPLIQDGRLNVLAVLLDGRASVVKDAPSLKELGIGGVSGAGALQAVVGPPGMSRNIAARLEAAIRKVVDDPQVRAKFALRGQQAETSTPDSLRAMLRSEQVAWERFALEEHIQPQ